MNLWKWLTTPDPEPGFTRGKIIKLLVRIFLFAAVASLLSSLLSLTPLKPYLSTVWGSMLFVFLLYIPVARYMMVDKFVPSSKAVASTTTTKSKSGLSAQQRRKERNRYAGVKKSAPKYGGRR